MDTRDKEILIQEFLEGTITEEGRALLAKAVEQDPELAEQLDIQSLLYAHRNKSLKAEIKQVQGEKAKGKEGVIREGKLRQLFSRNWLDIAASLFLVSVFIYYASQKNTGSLSEQLVISHLSQSFEAPPKLVGKVESPADDWIEAMALYRQEKFAEAAKKIEEITERTDEQELYLGLSHLFAVEPNETSALQSFEKVLDSPKDTYRAIALWYSSLGQLKVGEAEIAKDHLEEIVVKQSWNYQKAKRLLETL